jgi:hypothetical protein
MNDPIRDLWVQCVLAHTRTPMNWQTVADEFAELIIRRCALTAGLMEHSGRKNIGAAILDSFEIEE